MAGEIALPQIVLEVGALLRQVGNVESGTEDLPRVADQTHSGQRAVGLRDVREKAPSCVCSGCDQV